MTNETTHEDWRSCRAFVAVLSCVCVGRLESRPQSAPSRARPSGSAARYFRREYFALSDPGFRSETHNRATHQLRIGTSQRDRATWSVSAAESVLGRVRGRRRTSAFDDLSCVHCSCFRARTHQPRREAEAGLLRPQDEGSC